MSLQFTVKKERSVFQAINNLINYTAQVYATLHHTSLSPVSARHLLKNFTHVSKYVKRNCINKYISVILTNTLPTAKQGRSFTD